MLRLFFPLPPPFLLFFLSPGDLLVSFFLSLGSSGRILVVFWSVGTSMCLVSPSICPVKPRRPGHPKLAQVELAKVEQA